MDGSLQRQFHLSSHEGSCVAYGAPHTLPSAYDEETLNQISKDKPTQASLSPTETSRTRGPLGRGSNWALSIVFDAQLIPPFP